MGNRSYKDSNSRLNEQSMTDLYTPFFIGITGHRVLVDPELISKAIDDCLTIEIEGRIKSRCNGKLPYRFIGISPLADGSDRLFAEQINGRENYSLSVVLPFEKNLYKCSFVDGKGHAFSDSSLEEFDKLLSVDSDYLELFKLRHAPTENKDRFYYHTGKFVVDNSDIVIAVWDGNPGKGFGGTADIVAYARRMNKPVIVIDPHDGQVKERYNLESYAPPHLIEDEQISGKVRATIVESKNRIKDLLNEVMVDERNHDTLEPLLSEYAKFDTLSSNHKQWFRGKGVAVFVLAFFALICGVIGILIPSVSIGFHFLELAMLIAITCIHRQTKKSRNQEKWLGYRVIAEKLRLDIYRILSMGKLSPYFLSRPNAVYWNDGSWIFRNYYSIVSPFKLSRAVHGTVKERSLFIVSSFIDNQISYHGQNKGKRFEVHHLLERFSEWIPKVTIAVVLVILAVHAIVHYIPISQIHSFEIVIYWLALILPGMYASIEGVMSLLQHERVVGRHSRMLNVLEDLKVLLLNCNSEEELEDLMNQVENVMLYDNIEWQELMKFSKVSAVA